ncbi:MAG: class I SAM-dependent methyltransferase [Desulfobulbaceae bacterium]|nr:class I SAM-dependent methyltransferase [Desulfobulbaceae bacterium]
MVGQGKKKNKSVPIFYSSYVATAYQHSDITLIDVSENMIKQAQSSLPIFQNNFSYLVADYSVLNLPQKFDVIISALSIHHLSDAQKEILFRSILNHLNFGGIFVNADQVKGETAEIEQHYRQEWLRKIQERGVSETELHEALERMKEDKMSTLSAQMQWLKNSGFSDVNCWYKNYSFTVFSGRNLMK